MAVNYVHYMYGILYLVLYAEFKCIAWLQMKLKEFAISEAKRSGGRYGASRYGGSRTRVRYGSSRTRVRYGSTRTRVRYGSSRNRVRYGGTRVRIRAGSSPYTRSTFSRALMLGYLYGSVRYMRTPRYIRYPDRMPTICTNKYDSDSNGTVYGYFICPRMGEPENFEYCCGDNHRERCCEYFDEDDQGRTAGIVVGVIILIIIIAIIVYCVCKRTGTGGQVMKKYSSKKNDVPVNMVPVPTQPQPQNHPGSYPPTNDYNYSNTSNQYTPKPEKPPMPQADFSNGGQPYPPYGADSFPQGNQGAYPPPSPYNGNQPYPNASPYPPGGIPYPNADAYQQSGNNPYPPGDPSAAFNSNPYPPPQGYDNKGPGYPNSPPPPYPQ
ncbi:hypothetical protein LOTGIDRAFT_174838 [Lottia gigantea]|uniref:Uncharacterized protein n=1 Tax=Lottia gigantea TaxID=225164 RepID=V4ANQ9_LOTGI|nr:hypothetical protein LOTGIDRAFT_174838 [Lottia gigantea]ESO96385.1 hypothetical protein LOTGIDRAFT_174838 [Lottia gigantea]